MNKEEFLKELTNLNITLTTNQISQLDIYYQYLQEYNNHTNLTTITSLEDVYLKHFYDSLTIVKEIDLTKVDKVLDIGTGAGFPGMVLKICFPHINLTLLDSNNKKIKFLEDLKEKLNLEVTLVHNRAEAYIKNHREEFDLVVTRAVASLPILCELCIPYLKVNSYFIAMKSNIDKEVNASTKILGNLNSKIISITEFNLPKELSKRTIIKIQKLSSTNLKYPREYNKIKKEVSQLL